MVKTNGVDISRWNGDVDFAHLKNHIDFLIMRCSIGVPSVNSSLYGVDTKFSENVSGCLLNKIPFGVYHYATATTVEQAKEEARLVLNAIKGLKLDYPIFYDVEDDETIGTLDKNGVAEIICAFCKEIENAGYFVGVYSNKNWLENKINYSRIKQYAIWLAQWASAITWTAGDAQMWQYTSDGYFNGVAGRFDLDYCFVDYPSIMRSNGLNGYGKTETVAETPKAEEKPIEQPQTNVYTVVSGDTMSGIAKKLGVKLADLKKANPQIKNYNLIYAGDKINIPTTATVSTNKKSNEEIAKEVIRGLWGNGADRKNRLETAGYDYKAIQDLVNKMI